VWTKPPVRPARGASRDARSAPRRGERAPERTRINPAPADEKPPSGAFLLAERACGRSRRFDRLAERVGTHAVRPAGVSVRPSAREAIPPLPMRSPLAGLFYLAERACGRSRRFDRLAERVGTHAVRPAGVSVRLSAREAIPPLPMRSPLAGLFLFGGQAFRPGPNATTRSRRPRLNNSFHPRPCG